MIEINISNSESETTKDNSFYEMEGRALPFDVIKNLFLSLKYASTLSIGCKLLYYTGCRIAELEEMKKENIINGFLYWRCGKNQTKHFRKEYLPCKFIEEIKTYWKTNRTPYDKIMGVKSDAFRMYFVKNRHRLNNIWGFKIPIYQNKLIKYEYKYQLKGFRKTFATLLFYYYWRKYSDANIGAEMVAKRMKHSAKHITITHYIENAEQIQANKFTNLMPFQIVDNTNQKRITEY